MRLKNLKETQSMRQAVDMAVEEAVFEEAVNSRRYYDQIDSEGSANRGYRQIYPLGRNRRSYSDLPEQKHKEMLEVALLLYQTNAIAHRYIEMQKDFVIGDGVKIVAPDPNVQKALDAFWFHPKNEMEERLPKLCTELSIYGEILLTFFVEKNTNILRLSYISPDWIDSVVRDPNDVSHYTKVILKQDDRDGGGITSGNPEVNLLHYDEDDGMLVGDGIYQAINTVSSNTRGISDLFPLGDSIANLEEFMFNMIERGRHMSSWFYDITIQGSNEKQQREFLRKLLYDPIRPGAYQIHNEKITMETKSVDLKAEETAKTYEALFGHIVTGLGIPPHWTGLVSQMGRAGAEPMQEPAYKKLISRQNILRRFIRKILNYQLDYLIRNGVLDRNVDKTFGIEMPKIAVRDFQRIGGVVNRIADAIIDAFEAGLYTNVEAKERMERLVRLLDEELFKEQGG